MYKNILVIILLTNLFLLISNTANANYSEPYDKDLSTLVITEPNKALKKAKDRYDLAKKSQNINQQLISLFYIAQAMDILSEQDKLDETIQVGFNLANKNKNNRFISEFLGLIAYRLELKGQYLDAIKTSNEALQYARETSDNRLIAEQLALRGQLQLAIENYDFALKDIEKAISIFKLNNDKENLSLNYNLMAIVYSTISDYDNAIKYYNESEAYDTTHSTYNKATHYYNLGSVYFSKDDYDQAIKYYKKSSEFSKQTNDSYSLAFTKYGIAEVYLIQKEIAKAEKELIPTLEIFEQNNDLLMLYNSNLLMSEIKVADKQYDEAFKYISHAENQNKILNTPIVNLNLITQKTKFYVAKKEWQKAYKLNQEYIKINDEIIERNKKNLISELKVRYNAQFDQEKLELLQQQNKFQKDLINQEKITKKYLWSLIVLGSILLLITYFAYNNQKNIKRHLYKLSITDYLTKVSNRRHIIQRLKELHENNEQEFSLIMLDLDYFKSINDNYGHDTGNEVLKYFAKTAQRVFFNIGEIGRIGGEEWIILVHSNNKETIKAKISELRLKYQEALSISIPEDCTLSFSSGIITNTRQYKNHEKMLSDVDKAMYQAKKSGREQDVFV